MALSGGFHPILPRKDIEKKVNLTEESQDAKMFLFAPILFLYYEEIVCPLLSKYNNVYFVSSLTAKPNARSKRQTNIYYILAYRNIFNNGFFRKKIETMDKRNLHTKICYCLGFCKWAFSNNVGKKRWVTSG